MVCRLCLDADTLVKAHVIPEAFFRLLRVDDEAPLIVTDKKNKFPKKSPIGIYDKDILCNKCEPKFDRVDHYGTKIFINQREKLFQSVSDGNKTAAFRAHGVDQKCLLQFLVATLWRASVSTQPFYKRVRLGSYEEVARQVILNPDAPIPASFAAVLSCWNVDEEHQTMANGLMDPFHEKLMGVNSYRVYFGQVVAYIKVDRRPLPAPFDKLALLAQDQITLVARDFTKSKDYVAMRQTAISSNKNFQQARIDRLLAK